MTATVDLDHTSFAVRDALTWAALLRRQLGATPIAGETLAEFRYLLLYVGDAHQGGRIELMEPVGEGFLSRFLDRRGEGAHHITFTVPDLRATVMQVRAAGATVVGEDYEHSAWREAFIAPDGVHGVVIQLAQSDRAYPSPAQLLASTTRDTARFPSSRGASDPLWWTPVWANPAGGAARLGPTQLGSTDPAHSRRLFGDVLGGQVEADRDGFRFVWPSGTVHVHESRQPGVTGITVHDGPASAVAIGSCLLRAASEGEQPTD